MVNEAKTMNLFRELLRQRGYYDDPTICVEEQASDNKKVQKLLKCASKSGLGKGYPDFIITSSKYHNLIIVVECKAEISRQKSATVDNFKDYAVDGALLYASFLAKEYDVIAIGFSGEKKNLTCLEHYIQIAKTTKPHPYFSDEILTLANYNEGVNKSTYKFNQDYNELINYTKELNEKLQEHKIKESKRALLISGVLMALRNERFKADFKSYGSIETLSNNLYAAICAELDQSDVPDSNKNALKKGYDFIATSFGSNHKNEKEFLTNLIDEADKRINGFMVTYKYIDTVSQFYVEFLRYANNDKGLGIVLTPPHITQLFVELAGVNKDSVVLDNCAGTGGFLVSAMKTMLEDAKGDIAKETSIKHNQLLGIELDVDIYTLLISNMIIHRDGRTNITLGNCFEQNTEAIKKKFKPTVGLLNPPYKNKGKGTEELEFVLNNLSMLDRGGKCVAIMPISCVNDVKGTSCMLKRKILEHNTLEAVLSLPEELFVNSKVNTVTCAVVITAGIPHPKGKKTWFGYCRDDGFVKKKNVGRVDANHSWDTIKRKWVDAFMNREVISEFSVMKEVTATMEWCAEAYLEANYGKLTQADFENTIRNYVLFQLKYNETDNGEGEEV